MDSAALSRIDLNLLVVLDVLLRERSVSRTATKLNLTSSAISHALKRLRTLFQNELLVREGRYMVPTTLGESLAETLPPLIAQMEDDTREDAISAPHFIYALGLTHKHVPEITTYGMLTHAPIFTPSVGRFPQGMIVQVPLHIASLNNGSQEAVHAALAAHYEGSDHVRVASLEESAGIVRLDATTLADQDTMDLHVFGHEGQINLVAVLDNLGKGASGACVQALDLMLAAKA